MMDERILRKTLFDLPLGGLRFFEQTGSTNDVALAWATAGAPDLALVYAEEQTAGRGRGDRRWFTPPGAALAFSLVLRPRPGEQQSTPFFSALGALAVCTALGELGLSPEIKWPNDVLLNRRKVCGILVESVWMGEKVDSIVLGIGINIKAEAVPPRDQLNFPATYLEAELASHEFQEMESFTDRLALLHSIVQGILYWRDSMAAQDFLQAWESRLAFRGELVEVGGPGQETRVGRVDGLEEDGHLRLTSPQGEAFRVAVGEIHLRPVV